MLAAAKRAEADEFVGGLTDPKGRNGYDAHDGLYARLWAHQSGGFLGDDLVEVAAYAEEAISQARGEVEALPTRRARTGSSRR
jgi:hypothetical protein